MRRRGILITNLGSPANPSTSAVKAYLSEFLTDPHVITLSNPWRYLLAKTITQTRAKTSAAAYRKIWDSKDGPLIYHCKALASRVRQATELPVAVAMRYGKPSLSTAHDELLAAGCSEILAILGYPHYANSTFKSTVERLKSVFAGTKVAIVRPYYDDPDFIEAHAQLLRRHLPSEAEHLLFSFHGLPEQHIRQADPSRSHCLHSDDCCSVPDAAHATCYRFQCIKTAELLSERVSVPTSVAFQSRLGRAHWLQPYTVNHVQSLARKGIRHLAIAAPAFVADNLETLYELEHEVKAEFLAAGGERLDLIPCLNESEAWVSLVARWCGKDLSCHATLDDF